MAQPTRTFTESTTLMTLLTASKIASADLGSYYNLSYRDVVSRHQWQGRTKFAIVNTVDPYSTGTASATQGSTTVTGSGTTWTSGMVGRYIRLNDEDTYYKIATFVSATNITIEAAWPFANATNVAYEIFGLDYALPSDCEMPMPTLTEWAPIHELSLDGINLADPARRTSGGTPLAWSPKGLDSSGNVLIEFWPRLSAATSIRVPYMVRVDDLSGSQTPIMPADVIETRALAWCFRHLATKFGDQAYVAEADRYDKEFAETLDKAIREDYAKHALPRSVQWSDRGISGGHEYIVTHDV